MPKTTCATCGSHSQLLSSLLTQNSELRQHNQILARQISILRSQLDTKSTLSSYWSDQSSQPSPKQLENFCIQLVSKIERHNVEMAKKRNFYEKELVRYRGLVSKLIRELTREGKSSAKATEQDSTFDSVKKPADYKTNVRHAKANASVETVRSVSTSAPRSNIGIKSIKAKQPYFSSFESEGVMQIT